MYRRCRRPCLALGQGWSPAVACLSTRWQAAILVVGICPGACQGKLPGEGVANDGRRRLRPLILRRRLKSGSPFFSSFCMLGRMFAVWVITSSESGPSCWSARSEAVRRLGGGRRCCRRSRRGRRCWPGCPLTVSCGSNLVLSPRSSMATLTGHRSSRLLRRLSLHHIASFEPSSPASDATNQPSRKRRLGVVVSVEEQ